MPHNALRGIAGTPGDGDLAVLFRHGAYDCRATITGTRTD
jgi:hypothetical protein